MIESKWLELWQELVIANLEPKTDKLYQRYEAHARKKTERPDPLLDFVLQNVIPQDTVIDIGPGSGRWTLPLARIARSVTGIEPTEAMVNILGENIAASGLKNIRIVSSTWEKAEPEAHDTIVCSHAMYSSPDLAEFVRKMDRLARKGCYLAIRLPPADGVLGELSQQIFGRSHDSADAVVAYNALYSLGIYVNILVEKGIVNWVNSTLEEAFERAKRHLHLEERSDVDQLIQDTLQRKLVYANGVYVWPDGMRSALLWWNPSHQ